MFAVFVSRCLISTRNHKSRTWKSMDLWSRKGICLFLKTFLSLYKRKRSPWQLNTMCKPLYIKIGMRPFVEVNLNHEEINGHPLSNKSNFLSYKSTREHKWIEKYGNKGNKIYTIITFRIVRFSWSNKIPSLRLCWRWKFVYTQGAFGS